MNVVVDKDIAAVLLKEIKELKLSYVMLRMDASMGKLTDTSKLSKIKKSIAQKFTYLHQAGAWEAEQRKNNSGSTAKKK